MHVTLIFVLFLLPSMTSHTPASHLKYTHLCPSHNPLQCSCLENPMGGGAWWATVHGVAKGRTRLSDFTFTFHFHALEKEMATHSSVLAWRIPGTGEPGGLPPVGSHRVGHDWSDFAAAATAVAASGFVREHFKEEIIYKSWGGTSLTKLILKIYSCFH